MQTQASRMVVLLSFHAKELEQHTKTEESIYSRILCDWEKNNDTGFAEFHKLGSMILVLNEIVQKHGESALEGSSFDLPFDLVPELQPAKAPARVDTLQRLQSLQRMWCNVFTNVSKARQRPQVRF